jgi:hypothetical protein
MKRRLLFGLPLVLLLTASTYKPAIRAADPDFIFCDLSDGIHKVDYYSDVFPGDYSLSTRYSNAFTDHVHGKYSDVKGVASCFFTKDVHESRAKEDKMRSNTRMVNFRVVDTGWTY